MEFTLEEHQVMLEILNDIEEDYRAGKLKREYRGICSLARECCLFPGIPFTGQWLREAARSWPKFSGDFIYLVPCPYGGSPAKAFETAVRSFNLWSRGDEYAALRVELLHFLIGYAERQIAGESHAIQS